MFRPNSCSRNHLILSSFARKNLKMAYPGIALVAMVGVGLGLALWYFLTDTNNEHHLSAGPPTHRESTTTSNSWEIPNDARRRRPRSNSKANDDCPICTEPMDRFIETVSCGHDFHKSCIKKWRETQGGDPRSTVTCPLCRQSI